MRFRSCLALSAIAFMALPSMAVAADLDGSPIAPAPKASLNLGGCPPPAVHAGARAPITYKFFHRRMLYVQAPRVVTVEPFDGVIPGPPKYVPPQTAYLASSVCPPSLGPSVGGTWYDGKTFYYRGTTPQRPDKFQIVVEPGTVRGFRRLWTRAN
jgi:hypothetical protein